MKIIYNLTPEGRAKKDEKALDISENRVIMELPTGSDHRRKEPTNMKQYLLPESGSFYKVNMHSHSNLSDGRQTPEELKEAYGNE